MRKMITCLAAIFFAVCVNAQQPPKQENTTPQFPQANAYTNTKLTYKIIDALNHTYCYDVFSDDRLMIHQKSMPAVPGNKGFKTKADAEKVAHAEDCDK